MSRVVNDYYPTPHSIISVLVERISHWPRSVVWEPCAGDGRLVRALAHHTQGEVISHDVTQGHDFFDWTQAQAPTLVTNPPFRLIRLFIDHAFSIGVERMALVCPERLWACERGRLQLNRHRPSAFFNLAWREDYLGKGKAPDRALAISIWDSPSSFATAFDVLGRPNPPSSGQVKEST